MKKSDGRHEPCAGRRSRTSRLAGSGNGYVSSVCRLKLVDISRTPEFVLEGVEACATCHVEHEILEAEIGAGGVKLYFAA